MKTTSALTSWTSPFASALLCGAVACSAPEDPASSDASEDSEKLAESDFQLYEALNLLKGLNILSSING